MHRTLRSCSIRRSMSFCRLQHTKAAVKSAEEWRGVVGLEIHAQIATKSKLFARASTDFSSPVNSNVSLFDASVPGTLPVINKSCVEAAVKTALALECQINPASTFDRKHYFYADMPAGYQITQQRNALAHNGVLRFYVTPPDGKPYLKSSKLKQLQLEQDSGKSLHDTVENKSLVDLNRAGVGLMELVFEPDLASGEEAASLVKELILIMERLKTCDCKMEEGSMRVDANVSVQKVGATELGPRTEIKNISSIRGVANAITWEIRRQIEANLRNEKIIVETRSYDGNTKTTVAMRDKEEKQDYRFMPEPNLPPLRLTKEASKNRNIISINSIQETLPELPERTRQVLLENYDLATIHAINLVNDRHLLDLYNNIVRQIDKPNGRGVYEVIFSCLLTLLNKEEIPIEKNPITIPQLMELYQLRESRKISASTAVKVMTELLQDPNQDITKMVEVNGWFQIIDPEAVRKICEEVIKENAKKVKSYKKGKEKAFGSLLSSASRKANGQIDMSLVKTCLEELIEKENDLKE